MMYTPFVCHKVTKSVYNRVFLISVCFVFILPKIFEHYTALRSLDRQKHTSNRLQNDIVCVRINWNLIIFVEIVSSVLNGKRNVLAV